MTVSLGLPIGKVDVLLGLSLLQSIHHVRVLSAELTNIHLLLLHHVIYMPILRRDFTQQRLCTSCCLPLSYHKGQLGTRCSHGDGIRQYCAWFFRSKPDDLPVSFRRSLTDDLSAQAKFQIFNKWLATCSLGASNATRLVIHL